MADVTGMVEELRVEGKTGQEIARVLLEDGCSIGDAQDAFLNLGYVSSTQPFMADLKELHVSNEPVEPGIGCLVTVSEPRALPSVIWDEEYLPKK